MPGIFLYLHGYNKLSVDISSFKLKYVNLSTWCSIRGDLLILSASINALYQYPSYKLHLIHTLTAVHISCPHEVIEDLWFSFLCLLALATEYPWLFSSQVIKIKITLWAYTMKWRVLSLLPSCVSDLQLWLSLLLFGSLVCHLPGALPYLSLSGSPSAVSQTLETQAAILLPMEASCHGPRSSPLTLHDLSSQSGGKKEMRRWESYLMSMMNL
jgi:hypothetical protein